MSCKKPINVISIMSRIEQSSAKVQFRIQGTHLGIGSHKSSTIMAGSLSYVQKDRQVINTICRSQSVKRVSVEPTFMITVPAPVGSGVGIQPGTGTTINTPFFTLADLLTIGAGTCFKRGAIASEHKVFGVTTKPQIKRWFYGTFL